MMNIEQIVTSILLACVGFDSANSVDNNAMLPEFEAVAGTTAQIPCLVPQRPPESGIKCIFWYKDDEVMSVYTIDAREGSHSLHVPSDRLRSRATFDPSPWPPVLKMVSVKEEDAGTYYCRVDYRWDRTYMYTTILKVIVPPQKLTIMNEHEEEINGLAGPYLEGQSVKLICEAVGGKPLPTLAWYQGDDPLKDGVSFAMHEVVVRNELSFVPRRANLLTSVTCKAINNNITNPKMVSIQIDMYLKPLDIQLSPAGIALSAGRKVDVRCYSGGSRPPARMTWFLDREPLFNHTDLVSSDRNLTTSILSFWPSRSDHRKILKCKAENFLLQGSTLEEGWTLNVTYVPLVTMTVKSSSKRSSLLEGDDVRFMCEVKANPDVTEIGWLFNGRPLEPDAELIVSYRSLLVRRVKRVHRGRYQCFASNSEGSGFSRVYNLRALYAPVCRPALKTTYSVSMGEMARVECQVEADPPKVDFKWSFSNSVDRHYNVSYTSAGLRSVASYTPGGARDFGTLYCWGANSVGEQQKPCIFTVIPVGPPETLQNCSATNISMSSVTIMCERGKKQDSDLRYNLEMYMYDSHSRAFLTSRSIPIFYVPDLPSDTDLLFAVYAVNVNGKSSPVLVRVRTLRTPVEERIYHEKQDNEEKEYYPWLGLSLLITGAIGCAVVFLAAALWKKFRVIAGCEKCKEIPKQIKFKTSFKKNRDKDDKNYIDRTAEIWDRAPCM